MSARRGRRPEAPLRLGDLDPAGRRRALVRFSLRMALIVGALLAAYLVAPLRPAERDAALVVVLRGALSALLFVGAMVWEVRGILAARLPQLRAVEAALTALLLFIVLFASLYLSMSMDGAGNFSRPLNRVGAFYFATTVVATVGFGDVVAATDAARVLVTVQMLTGLVLIAGIVRALLDIGHRRADAAALSGQPPPAPPVPPAGPR